MWFWFVFITLVVLDTSQAASSSEGLLKLCQDSQPDGVAIFDRPPGESDQVLAIFKADRVWTVSLGAFIDAIQLNESLGKHILYPHNGFDARVVFPGISARDKRVVSFFGLAKDDPFYNNLLTLHLHNDELLRYRVVEVSADRLEASLISKHTIRFWPLGGLLKEADAIFQTIRGNKLLLVHTLRNVNLGSMYIINKDNLDYPPMFATARDKVIPHADAIRATYKVSSGNGTDSYHLSFLTTGYACYHLKCVKLNDLIDCEPLSELHMRNFAYWLQHKTNMSLRLILMILIVIMIFNSAMAMIFVTNQINKISLLV